MLFGKCQQIIQLHMQNTLLVDTNFTSLLQAPSLYHTRWSFRPKATSIFPAFRSGWRGYSRCFLQRPIPGPRHPWYFVSRGFFVWYNFFTGSIQGPGHPIFVFAHVYGRALGFFQRPRSISWWSSHPGLSVCSTSFLHNIPPLQTSAFKVVFTGFHQTMSNVCWLSF